MWAYMPRGMDLHGRQPPNLLWRHLQARVGISLMVTVGEGWAGCMPITLSWQVTMSTDMVPHPPWTIQLTNRVDPTT